MTKPTITRDKAIDILSKHQKWRRHRGSISENIEMQDLKELGLAIDLAIIYLNLEKLNDTIEKIATMEKLND